MTKIKYFCLDGRIQTAAGIIKNCTFSSQELKESSHHNCPVCGKQLLQQDIK